MRNWESTSCPDRGFLDPPAGAGWFCTERGGAAATARPRTHGGTREPSGTYSAPTLRHRHSLPEDRLLLRPMVGGRPPHEPAGSARSAKPGAANSRPVTADEVGQRRRLSPKRPGHAARVEVSSLLTNLTRMRADPGSFGSPALEARSCRLSPCRLEPWRTLTGSGRGGEIDRRTVLAAHVLSETLEAVCSAGHEEAPDPLFERVLPIRAVSRRHALLAPCRARRLASRPPGAPAP
jgi:hypothetical protein